MFSLVLAKVGFFVMNILIIRWLTKEDYGRIYIAINYVSFFMAMVGMGNYQGVLRYNSIMKKGRKTTLVKDYAMGEGLKRQMLLNIGMLILAFVFFGSRFSILEIIAWLSIRFLGFYFLEFAKVEARSDFDNKKFVLYDVSYTLSSLILGIGLTCFFGAKGYLISLCVSPYVLFLFKRFRFSFRRPEIDFNFKEFWHFSWVTALTTQISGWIFMLDIFMIGNMLPNTSVVDYRVASIIPFNLLFIGQIFMQTDYPKLCKEHRNIPFLKKYITNYTLVMLAFSVIIFLVSHFFSTEILGIFGKNYKDSSLFNILIFGTMSALLVRIPYGNFLAALGKSHWNLLIAIFINLFIVAGLYLVIPKYGLKGVAYFTVGTITLSGVLSMTAFFHEIKKSNTFAE